MLRADLCETLLVNVLLVLFLTINRIILFVTNKKVWTPPGGIFNNLWLLSLLPFVSIASGPAPSPWFQAIFHPHLILTAIHEEALLCRWRNRGSESRASLKAIRSFAYPLIQKALTEPVLSTKYWTRDTEVLKLHNTALERSVPHFLGALSLLGLLWENHAIQIMLWLLLGPRNFCLRVCVCVQSYLILCNPMDYNPPGSSVHGIFQAKKTSGLPFPSPGDLPDPEIEPASLVSSALADRFLYH